MAVLPPAPRSTLDTGANSRQGPAFATGAPPGVTKVNSGAATPMRHRGDGFLRVVSNDDMTSAEKSRKDNDLQKAPEEAISALASYLRSRFEKAVRNRRTIGLDDDLIRDMRAYNGQYSPTKLQEIKSFGGSEVYSRLMTMKCRGATALLRNVYMNSDRAWELTPSPDPEIPDAIDLDVKTMVKAEVRAANALGVMVSQGAITQRLEQMYDAVKLSERRKAEDEAKEAQRKIDDILTEGAFYPALSDFLSDLPVYKYAIIKGPILRKSDELKWTRSGQIKSVEKPKMFWDRVSPWDVWFSPGATNVRNTEVFERQRLSTADLYDMIGLPGYREDEIRQIIATYEGRGFKEWIQIFDYERAHMEGRNNTLDDTFINAVEFHGYVLGRYLKEYGIPNITDDQKPYFVTAWMVDTCIFKVMLNPSPRKRVPYYITSFDKQPGSLYGNGIPSLANDLTDIINATLRAIVNNIAISSGPQVVYDEDLISPMNEPGLRPWKEWRYTGDPANPNRKPVDFFQPEDNSANLMSVIDKFSVMLDDVSTIPRYLTGGGASSGAGRTASGLSMLINNANKTLQNVADNIDKDIFDPLLNELYDFVMLTDSTGFLRGDESIVVDGVRQAAKQEQDLTRQLEFLNIVGGNQQLQQFLGPGEIARVLQAISDNLGMELKIKNPDDSPGAAPPGLPPGAQPVQSMMPNGGGGGANPTGNNTANPNPAQAAPGAGGVPGIVPAPQVAPVNTVQTGQGVGGG